MIKPSYSGVQKSQYLFSFLAAIKHTGVIYSHTTRWGGEAAGMNNVQDDQMTNGLDD